jgi:hypothetical protein
MTVMPKKPAKPARATPGPKPDVLKLDGDWTELVKRSFAKKKPAGGWPDGEAATATGKKKRGK